MMGAAPSAINAILFNLNVIVKFNVNDLTIDVMTVVLISDTTPTTTHHGISQRFTEQCYNIFEVRKDFKKTACNIDTNEPYSQRALQGCVQHLDNYCLPVSLCKPCADRNHAATIKAIL